jgi:3-oxoacyl-[acyl-carrier protein] reductase
MNEPRKSEFKHVILSGGSRGLGKALVEGLLAAGYRVSTFSRKPNEFTERYSGNKDFFFVPADMSDPRSLTEFMKLAEGRCGPPYGLVNCAGVAMDGVIATMADETFEQLVSINLLGTLRLTKVVVRKMLLNHSPGVIINISSIVGLRGYSGLAAYGATKAALDSMTRALARELGTREIRVNSIAPGYLRTEMTQNMSEAQQEQIVRRTPLGRLGLPEDVVGPVLFLLSDAARFVTGQVMVVDGGISA